MRIASLFVLLLLLAACSTSPYRGIPRHSLPESSKAAARHLNEAMAFDGVGYSEVWADEIAVRWQQRRDLTDKYTVWVERELQFRAITSVARAVRAGEVYEVVVRATGGTVTLRFRSGEGAGKAEAALRRLSQQQLS